MNINDKFKELRDKNEKALIIFITGGYPNYDLSKKIIKTVAESGADIIEVGIPFSDPVADGPVIQKASEIALKNGFSLNKAIQMVKELRCENVDIPITFMSYYNVLFNHGLQNLANDLSDVEVNGLIIPDLPPEEADELTIYTKEKNIDMIYLLAPTMTDDRLDIVSKNSSGFIYFVSVAGVTGTRTVVNNKLPDLIKKVKEKTDVPVGVGFGVSKKEQVDEINSYADAVIIGSAVINKITENLNNEEKLLEELSIFIKELKGKIGRAHV